jgi:hypothetical protein
LCAVIAYYGENTGISCATAFLPHPVIVHCPRERRIFRAAAYLPRTVIPCARSKQAGHDDAHGSPEE